MLRSLATTALALFTTLAQAATPGCETEPQLQLDRVGERVMLVGETHGNDQAPAFVARLVCGLLTLNRPVILALERDEAEQAAMDRFMASAGTPEDQRALLGLREWNMPMQDGRSSQAMFRLIDQMRRWRQAGQPVELVMMRKPLRSDEPAGAASAPTFDPKALQAKGDLDMADSVSAALARHPGHVAVVYAGTFHTVVGSKMHQDIIGAPSTGEVLASRLPVHVIGLGSAAGTSWVCFERDRCGPQALHAGNWDLPDARVDSRVNLGAVSASAPAGRPPHPQLHASEAGGG
jgi:erythromycin esterase-like protein